VRVIPTPTISLHGKRRKVPCSCGCAKRVEELERQVAELLSRPRADVRYGPSDQPMDIKRIRCEADKLLSSMLSAKSTAG
jgi:hypothetical protein